MGNLIRITKILMCFAQVISPLLDTKPNKFLLPSVRRGSLIKYNIDYSDKALSALSQRLRADSGKDISLREPVVQPVSLAPRGD